MHTFHTTNHHLKGVKWVVTFSWERNKRGYSCCTPIKWCFVIYLPTHANAHTFADMHLFNEEGVMKRYSSPLGIIQDHYRLRKQFYSKYVYSSFFSFFLFLFLFLFLFFSFFLISIICIVFVSVLCFSNKKILFIFLSNILYYRLPKHFTQNVLFALLVLVTIIFHCMC